MIFQLYGYKSHVSNPFFLHFKDLDMADLFREAVKPQKTSSRDSGIKNWWKIPDFSSVLIVESPSFYGKSTIKTLGKGKLYLL